MAETRSFLFLLLFGPGNEARHIHTFNAPYLHVCWSSISKPNQSSRNKQTCDLNHAHSLVVSVSPVVQSSSPVHWLVTARLVRCPVNGHLFTRLQYDIYLHLQRQTPPGEMPDQYQVHAETIDSGDSFPYCTDVIQATPDSDGKVFIQLNAMSCRRHGSRLEPHRKYRTIITAKNEAGESNSTGDIHFSKPVCS